VLCIFLVAVEGTRLKWFLKLTVREKLFWCDIDNAMFGRKEAQSTNLFVWIFLIILFGTEWEIGVETGSLNWDKPMLPARLYVWLLTMLSKLKKSSLLSKSSDSCDSVQLSEETLGPVKVVLAYGFV
jgi:hypothetical protein